MARGQIVPLKLLSATYPLDCLSEAMSRAAGRHGVTRIRIDI